MKKLFVFCGDSGSGKTTLIDELVKRHPNKFKKVVTCTSRLIRKGEVDGEDYHFLPALYFVNNPGLVLVKKTDDGNYYGARKEDLQSMTHHLLLTLRFVGIGKLAETGLNNATIMPISISRDLKIARMRQRGDTEEMIADRLKVDVIEKANINYGSFPVINLRATNTISENVEIILKVC